MKTQLRKYYLSKLKSLSKNSIYLSSLSCFNTLKPLLNTSYVMSYQSLSTEISTIQINQYLANRLILPKINLLTNQIDPYLILPNGTFTKSNLGILEPDPSTNLLINPNQIALILIPGVAFSSTNYRLGRGAGYYDRFLITLSPITQKIGIGFKCQLHLTELPIEEHDIKLDQVLLF